MNVNGFELFLMKDYVAVCFEAKKFDYIFFGTRCNGTFKHIGKILL